MSLFMLLPTGAPLDADLPIDQFAFHNVNNTTTPSGITVGTDGIAYAVGIAGDPKADDLGEWTTVGKSSDFWARATVGGPTALDTIDGSADKDIWFPCTSDITWYINDTTADDGAKESSVTIEVAVDSGGTHIVESKTYTLWANFATI
jgi:hypothetical protein